MGELVVMVLVIVALIALIAGVIRYVGAGPRDDDGSGHF